MLFCDSSIFHGELALTIRSVSLSSSPVAIWNGGTGSNSLVSGCDGEIYVAGLVLDFGATQ
jgi:hypothetical protein